MESRNVTQEDFNDLAYYASMVSARCDNLKQHASDLTDDWTGEKIQDFVRRLIDLYDELPILESKTFSSQFKEGRR